METPIKNEPDLKTFKEKLEIKLKPKKHKHFSCGSRTGNALLTQLRVGRSFLNEHRFNIGLSETKLCICEATENNAHFLMSCFLYTEERRHLFDTVEQILPTFKKMTKKKQIDTLLYGINLDINETDCRNKRIALAVQNYILKTKRF